MSAWNVHRLYRGELNEKKVFVCQYRLKKTLKTKVIEATDLSGAYKVWSLSTAKFEHTVRKVYGLRDESKFYTKAY